MVRCGRAALGVIAALEGALVLGTRSGRYLRSHMHNVCDAMLQNPITVCPYADHSGQKVQLELSRLETPRFSK